VPETGRTEALHLYRDGSALYRFCFAAVVPLLLALYADLDVRGSEHIPRHGPLIVISNHVDNLDTYVIGSRVPRLLHYFARANGLRSPWLGRYWRWMAAIPADREGFTTAISLLREGQTIGVFPEGVIAPTLVRAKPGVAVLALRSGAPVLPCAIWGTERVRVGDALRRPPIHLRFGPPRTLKRGSGRSQELADLLMRDVAALLPPRYRGVYR
jgi:1-acyl-sn-glycerol-3-phosphate acyltransferase